MSEPESGMELITLTVCLRLDGEGDEQVHMEIDPPDNSLVTLLGMIEFAKDSLLRSRADDDEDEEQP